MSPTSCRCSTPRRLTTLTENRSPVKAWGYPSSVNDPRDDQLIEKLHRFLFTWAEHDDDCPAQSMQGPVVMDSASCTCGLTLAEQEIVAELRTRLTSRH